MRMKFAVAVLAAFMVFSLSCGRKADKASVSIGMSFCVDTLPFVADTAQYVNEAGNRYLISEIQWFLSEVGFRSPDGVWHEASVAGSDECVCYVDTDLESTLVAHFEAEGKEFDSLRFVFGLSPAYNVSGRFVNPPESYMFWPEMLGGGYHHMKLNGKYETAEGLAPFNIHIGMGQNADMTEFYDNSFVVTVGAGTPFADGSTLVLTMNVNNWFSDPLTYDFDSDGTHIMQNQEAMSKVCSNGHNVFSLSVI